MFKKLLFVVTLTSLVMAACGAAPETAAPAPTAQIIQQTVVVPQVQTQIVKETQVVEITPTAAPNPSPPACASAARLLQTRIRCLDPTSRVVKYVPLRALLLQTAQYPGPDSTSRARRRR